MHIKVVGHSSGSLKILVRILEFSSKDSKHLNVPCCEEALILGRGCLLMSPLRSTAEVLGSWKHLQAYDRGCLIAVDLHLLTTSLGVSSGKIPCCGNSTESR